jgi:hypothetical protein
MNLGDVSGGGKLDRGEFFKFLLANKTHEAGAGSFRGGDVAFWLKSDADILDGSKGVVPGGADAMRSCISHARRTGINRVPSWKLRGRGS